jgi:hypothetical protein
VADTVQDSACKEPYIPLGAANCSRRRSPATPRLDDQPEASAGRGRGDGGRLGEELALVEGVAILIRLTWQSARAAMAGRGPSPSHPYSSLESS